MGPYPKLVSLKDGTEVTLRPMQEDDLDRSHRFFMSLPEEDRLVLRMDVTDREIVRIRMEQSDAEERWRLVALKGDEIIGDASLVQPRHGWKQHTAEIRCIVARPLQNLGLGRVLLNELFQEATRRGIEKVVGEVIEEQVAAKRILNYLGFREEMLLQDHRRTLHGELHDLTIMTASISDAWSHMEDLMHNMDGHGRERHPRRKAKP
ncbi:GNAT family N-acetyltransferase [Candidatus Eisenbacteria bacterium]|uniref:GNAT family N-acetyltransferase n=1 Tax=Eiseniibacteriota bacterium TaxID=2212470 RepID=A0ABV6YID3_UNCEI